MAKYYGKVGYAIPEGYIPGRWKDKIVERNYYGDTIRDTMDVTQGDKVNDDLRLSMSFRKVADPFALENCSSIRYIEFMGTLWKVTKIDPQYPRLVLTAGGVYNGERAQVAR